MRNLQQDYERFDKANPTVYSLFRRFAGEALDAGRDKYSARAIFHRIRWHTEIETRGDRFKVNNNHSPFYARRLEWEEPRFKGFFRSREAAADRRFP